MEQKDIFQSGIDPQKLPLLLGQKESATLEIKREWYKLNGNGEGNRRQKDELIKDILSLANGNAYSAGETAFLIIGADDGFNEVGTREIIGVDNQNPTSSDILKLVRAASSPPLENLEVLPFAVEDKNLFVIVIPPSPHLYETTRKLDATKSYSEHVVFIRSNENVEIASAREREVIKKIKEIRFADTRNAPPVLLATGVGAIVGGILLSNYGEKITGKKEGTIGGLIAGTMFGALLGGLTGNGYKNIQEIKPDWSRASWEVRLFSLFVGGLFASIIWVLGFKIGKKQGEHTV